MGVTVVEANPLVLLRESNKRLYRLCRAGCWANSQGSSGPSLLVGQRAHGAARIPTAHKHACRLKIPSPR